MFNRKMLPFTPLPTIEEVTWPELLVRAAILFGLPVALILMAWKFF